VRRDEAMQSMVKTEKNTSGALSMPPQKAILFRIFDRVDVRTFLKEESDGEEAVPEPCEHSFGALFCNLKAIRGSVLSNMSKKTTYQHINMFAELSNAQDLDEDVM